MVHHKRLAESCKAFFSTFKEGRRFCAFFLGIRDIGMMAGSARPLQINRKRYFVGDFRLGGEPRPTCGRGGTVACGGCQTSTEQKMVSELPG